MAPSEASDFMKAVAIGTTKKMQKEDFVDGVFCDREQWAGGDMHRRLLWTQCIFNFRVSADCPVELRNADPHRLAIMALNFAEHKTVPSEKALLQAFEMVRNHSTALGSRLADRQGAEEEVQAKRRLRQLQIRARADAQRAEEKRQEPSEENYQQVVNATSRELLKLLSLRPRILLDFRMALAVCKFDREKGRKRSFDHFKGGASILVEMVAEMLDGRTTSLSEYTMANWKKICDQAMSKWRPYAKKSAAAVGLTEIRFLAAGTSIYKPVDGSKATVTPLETLHEKQGLLVLADVKQRLRRSSSDDEEARDLFSFCLARVKEIQSYRAALVSAAGMPWVYDSPELAVLVAAGEKGFSPFKHREHGIQKAADYMNLATMSPLGLLQLVVSFVCTSPEGPNFWQSLLAWREAKLKTTEGAGGDEEKSALLRLLSVVSCCPRCNSEKTTQLWRKTRSADEPFQFLICCLVCKVATVIE